MAARKQIESAKHLICIMYFQLSDALISTIFRYFDI